MSNSSFAAQAVANGPMTAAPPSFDGHGWLVVVNMAAMTAAALIALMALIYIGQLAWRDRSGFPARTPIRLWRIIGSLVACGIMLRCGVEALNIWGWDPLRPAETARFLFLKRLVDPIAVACGVTGLGLFVLSAPGMIRQLSKKPVEVSLWQSRRILTNMAALAALSLVASIAVVSTR